MFRFARPQPIRADGGAGPSVKVARRGRDDAAVKERGQTLVEFAIVFPLFVILLLGLIEFGFMFNATLAVNFASRNASLTAAVAGTNAWSDCKVLEGIENDLAPPLDRSLIQNVAIFRTDRAGNPVSPVTQNVWTRSGSTLFSAFFAAAPVRSAGFTSFVVFTPFAGLISFSALAIFGVSAV